MKIKSFLLLLLTSVAFVSYSQNEYLDYRYSLSVNGHFEITSKLYNSKTFLGIPPSFTIMTKHKNQHEISIEKIAFSKHYQYLSPNNSYDSKNSDISLGYRYYFNFIKKKSIRWIPAIGLGGNLYYSNQKISSNSENIYSSNRHSVGIEMIVQPALTFHASKHIYLNVSFPVNFMTNSIYSSRVKDPNITPEQQRASGTNFTSNLDRFQFKFGIGVKF